jgi:hypothetical protein
MINGKRKLRRACIPLAGMEIEKLAMNSTRWTMSDFPLNYNCVIKFQGNRQRAGSGYISSGTSGWYR